MIMSTTADTLSSNEANELQDLIEKSQFFNLSSQSLEEASSKTKKKVLQITIQNGNREHTIECDDLSMPPNLKTVVNFLVKNSRNRTA
jgi:hypothetical protein